MRRLIDIRTLSFVVFVLACIPVITGCSPSDSDAGGRTSRGPAVRNGVGQDQPATRSAVNPASAKAVSSPRTRSSDKILQNAFNRRQSNLQVEGGGVVVKVLADDVEGSRHQRFILRLGTGQTLLLAHNIDLAPRIAPLQEGDVVAFYGEYEWNEKGGVIHWTHRDPDGRHVGGWLKHGGNTYQ